MQRHISYIFVKGSSKTCSKFLLFLEIFKAFFLHSQIYQNSKSSISGQKHIFLYMKKKNIPFCSRVRQGLGGGLNVLAEVSAKNVSFFGRAQIIYPKNLMIYKFIFPSPRLLKKSFSFDQAPWQLKFRSIVSTTTNIYMLLFHSKLKGIFNFISVK